MSRTSALDLPRISFSDLLEPLDTTICAGTESHTYWQGQLALGYSILSPLSFPPPTILLPSGSSSLPAGSSILFLVAKWQPAFLHI